LSQSILNGESLTSDNGKTKKSWKTHGGEEGSLRSSTEKKLREPEGGNKLVEKPENRFGVEKSD